MYIVIDIAFNLFLLFISDLLGMPNLQGVNFPLHQYGITAMIPNCPTRVVEGHHLVLLHHLQGYLGVQNRLSQGEKWSRIPLLRFREWKEVVRHAVRGRMTAVPMKECHHSVLDHDRNNPHHSDKVAWMIA
jgi:hypothetical protein